MTLLIVAGIGALAFRRARSRSWMPFAAAGFVYLLFGNGLVATLMMGPLEYAYPALKDPAEYPEARTIVVLTGYAAEDANMPFSSLLNATSTFRVIETAFIYAKCPDCNVIVSGTATAASIMGQHLRRLGVPESRLTIDGNSPDTADSAAMLHERAAGRPVFLVTSAGHMRRAVGSFLKQGVQAIPAPTDYQLPRDVKKASWTQSPTHLKISDLAAHEYLALTWYRLSGKI